jgi:hypothetical protein
MLPYAAPVDAALLQKQPIVAILGIAAARRKAAIAACRSSSVICGAQVDTPQSIDDPSVTLKSQRGTFNPTEINSSPRPGENHGEEAVARIPGGTPGPW